MSENIGGDEWGVDATDKEQVRRQLLDWKDDILTRLERSGQYGLDDAMSDELGELSMYDNHPADVATELFEREKDFGLRHLDQTRLRDVEGALKALESGTYGTCVECGRQIAEERLEANPLARRCMDCKRAEEASWPDLDRPIEEEFLSPMFGRSDEDGSDFNGFDGEDSWQAVWRFNQRPGYDADYMPHLERSHMDDNEGIVEEVDKISNEEYRAQLPD